MMMLERLVKAARNAQDETRRMLGESSESLNIDHQTSGRNSKYQQLKEFLHELIDFH